MSHAVGTKDELGSPDAVAFSEAILFRGVLTIGFTFFPRIHGIRLIHEAAVEMRRIP